LVLKQAEATRHQKIDRDFVSDDFLVCCWQSQNTEVLLEEFSHLIGVHMHPEYTESVADDYPELIVVHICGLQYVCKPMHKLLDVISGGRKEHTSFDRCLAFCTFLEFGVNAFKHFDHWDQQLFWKSLF
jgi:hypothetical protein